MPYLLLAGAILAEVLGTTAMKYSDGFTRLWPSVGTAVGYLISFGQGAAVPPGIGVFGAGAATQVRTIDSGTARYRVQLFVQAQNLTNERNYVGYSGTMTSPFFAKPTAVSGMRKIDAGIQFSF